MWRRRDASYRAELGRAYRQVICDDAMEGSALLGRRPGPIEAAPLDLRLSPSRSPAAGKRKLLHPPTPLASSFPRRRLRILVIPLDSLLYGCQLINSYGREHWDSNLLF